MYEFILPISLYLINSLYSGLYTRSFLEAKKNKKITTYVWSVLYFTVQIMVFEILARKCSFIDVIALAINIGILFLMQFVLYKRDISKQIFVITSFMAGKDIVKYISSVTYYILGEWRLNLFNKLFDRGVITTAKQVDVYFKIGFIFVILVASVVYLVFLGLYLYIINKKFVHRDYRFSKPEIFFLIMPAICALCVSVAIRMMIYSIENGVPIFIFEKTPATLFWIPVVCILLLVSVIVSVVIFQNIIQYQDEVVKRKVLESQVSQIQKDVSKMNEVYSDMRGLKHDMRNHLSNMVAFIRSGAGEESDELKKYIGKMEESIDKIDFVYQTGNPITDVIIHQKNQEASKKDIKFVSDFRYPIRDEVDVYDIGIILNNALDNAIEACEKISNNRKIWLKSYEKGNLYFIEIENTFDEIIMDPETGLPESDKADKELHGFGISNIEKSAKKYMGDIDIDIKNEDEKIFCLTVMLGKVCE